jgi:hypothetical protein
LNQLFEQGMPEILFQILDRKYEFLFQDILEAIHIILDITS